MARVASDAETPSGELLDEADDVLAWSADFQQTFRRVPDDVELPQLARCREALSWRIAPPRSPVRTSRVIAPTSQPSSQ